MLDNAREEIGDVILVMSESDSENETFFVASQHRATWVQLWHHWLENRTSIQPKDILDASEAVGLPLTHVRAHNSGDSLLD